MSSLPFPGFWERVSTFSLPPLKVCAQPAHIIQLLSPASALSACLPPPLFVTIQPTLIPSHIRSAVLYTTKFSLLSIKKSSCSHAGIPVLLEDRSFKRMMTMSTSFLFPYTLSIMFLQLFCYFFVVVFILTQSSVSNKLTSFFTASCKFRICYLFCRVRADP